MWGGMDKRRGHGIANTKKASGATLARVFPWWGITGKRRKLHPSDRRKPDPAAFAHATHLPIQSCTTGQTRFHPARRQPWELGLRPSIGQLECDMVGCDVHPFGHIEPVGREPLHAAVQVQLTAAERPGVRDEPVQQLAAVALRPGDGRSRYFKCSGLRPFRSSVTKRPFLRIRVLSNHISPPPFSSVCRQTISQWTLLLLPLHASS